jgi:hypothetical protein
MNHIRILKIVQLVCYCLAGSIIGITCKNSHDLLIALFIVSLVIIGTVSGVVAHDFEN